MQPILLAFVLSACGKGGDAGARVEARLAALSPQQRAALLLAVPVDLDSAWSESVAPPAKGIGRSAPHAPGALWLEGGSPEELERLHFALNGPWPPLILATVDRGVGGVVEGATLLPRIYDLTRAGWDVENLRHTGRLIERESRILGITLPVVSSPPLLNRADPLFLLRDSAGLAERYRAIFSSDGSGNAHLGLNTLWAPEGNQDESTWDRVRFEIVEGAAMFGALEGHVGAIVLTRIWLPALDAYRLPAVSSPSIIRGILRRDAGFQGLVIADLRDANPDQDRLEEIVAAIAAGADLVVTRADPAAAAAAIAQAAAEGRLPASRIDAAARRVLALSHAEPREPLPAATMRAQLADQGSLRLRDEAFRFIGGVESGAGRGMPQGSPIGGGEHRSVALPNPDALGLSLSDLAAVDREMESALADSVITGGAVVVIRSGEVALARGYGVSSDGSDVKPGSTIFDLASLSKVVGTTTAAAILIDRGELVLDAPVRRYLPDFRGEGKQDVTIRHLLTHTSGLPSGLWVYGSASSRDEAIREILEQPLVGRPGQRVVYSDLGYILLAEIVERLAGRTLDRFLAAELFIPLGMSGSMYLPPSSLAGRIVSTADRNERPYPLTGVVHDANAFRLQGVAGHAGIFATATDVGQFARMMLGGGETDGVRILSDSVVTMFRTKQPGAEERALGWDTPAAVSSAGRFASAGTYGHTGYTGTSLWIDPEYQLAIVLLTNRTYPGGSSSEILNLRTGVQEAIYQSITDREVSRRPGAR